MKRQPEFQLQKQVCKYLKLQYKDVLFLSDTIASVKLTAVQAERNAMIQKRGFKTPDLIIFEARRGFHGLFIELKIKSPYKKDGEIFTNEHLQGQEATIKTLRDKGFYADFKWTFQDAKDLIDWYLTEK